MLQFYWENAIRANWLKLGIIVSVTILVSFLQVVNLGMIIPVVTLLIGEPGDLKSVNIPLLNKLSAYFTPMTKSEGLVALLVLLLLVIVVKNALCVVRSYMSVRLVTGVRFSLSRRLFSHYLGAPYELQTGRPAGAILHQMWEPPLYVAETMRAGSELLANALLFIAIGAWMAWISWKLTLIVTLVAVAGVLLYNTLLQKPLRRISELNYSIIERMMAFLTDVMAGIRQVKAYAAEPRVMHQFDSLVDEIDRLDSRFARVRYWPSSLHEVFLMVLVAIIIVGTAVVQQLQMGLPHLLAFMLSIIRLGPTINGITEARVCILAASKNLERAESFLATWYSELNSGNQIPNKKILALTFKHVSFAYPTRLNAPVLQDVSLSFRVGEVTALVGASGAGKSTIADLIIRLFSPHKGSIAADGVDIRDFELAAWRRKIGFVSQDTFLFNASIRDNIALSDPSASWDTVRAAARLAHIHEFIEGLAEGYETVVGDRGVKLSGGQRQRVAIARALLAGPQIVIFDEATSALDNLSERAIQETINELRQGRIVIVIAHRLSTIFNADKIIVLEAGRVVEEGSHAELMDRGAAYAQLYSVAEP